MSEPPTSSRGALEHNDPSGDRHPPVVLFDGRCGLCHATVRFVIDHERAPILRFAPLESEIARQLLERAFGAEGARRLREGVSGADIPDSVVLVEGGRALTHSAAALRIARYLRAPFRWASVLVIVPRPLRDLVYRWVANNRRRWFGEVDACMLETPALRGRFLA